MNAPPTAGRMVTQAEAALTPQGLSYAAAIPAATVVGVACPAAPAD